MVKATSPAAFVAALPAGAHEPFARRRSSATVTPARAGRTNAESRRYGACGVRNATFVRTKTRRGPVAAFPEATRKSVVTEGMRDRLQVPSGSAGPTVVHADAPSGRRWRTALPQPAVPPLRARPPSDTALP